MFRSTPCHDKHDKMFFQSQHKNNIYSRSTKRKNRTTLWIAKGHSHIIPITKQKIKKTLRRTLQQRKVNMGVYYLTHTATTNGKSIG